MKIRGGMLLARALQEKGVEQVFTLSGGFCNPALEEFMECGIPVINAPHEQTAGHLAAALRSQCCAGHARAGLPGRRHPGRSPLR